MVLAMYVRIYFVAVKIQILKRLDVSNTIVSPQWVSTSLHAYNADSA